MICFIIIGLERKVMSQTLKKIELRGRLKEKYGKEFHMAIYSPAQALSALCSQLKGFRDDFRKGGYQILRKSGKSKTKIDNKNCRLGLGNDSLIIAPSISGAGGGGIGFLQPTGGIVGQNVKYQDWLLEQNLFYTASAISYDKREAPAQRPSFVFDGAVNTSEQGGPVPLVYGTMRTGSVVISSGLVSEEVE